MYIVLLVLCLSLYIQLGSEFSYSLTNTLGKRRLVTEAKKYIIGKFKIEVRNL